MIVAVREVRPNTRLGRTTAKQVADAINTGNLTEAKAILAARVKGVGPINAETIVNKVVFYEKAGNLHPTFKPGPYAGKSIPARSTAQVFTDAERAAINRIGHTTGCHTCGTRVPGTKSGNFVPDHQVVSTFNTFKKQRLYPQCIHCSHAQGLAALATWV